MSDPEKSISASLLAKYDRSKPLDNLFGSALHHQIKNELDLIDADWNIPPEYPDLTGYSEVAVDLETYDPNSKPWARDGRGRMGTSLALR